MAKVRTAEELLHHYQAGERNFQGWDLREAKLAQALLPGINLSFANLAGADLSSAQLPKADLHRRNLSMSGQRLAHRLDLHPTQ